MPIPVQIPKRFIDPYRKIYQKAWQAIKETRFEKAQDLELIPQKVALEDMLPTLGKWDTLQAEEKETITNDMAVNAARLSALDYHLGRYLDYPEKTGQMEKTMIVRIRKKGGWLKNSAERVIR